MSRIVTSISFNMDNDYERELYKYAKGKDQFFGKYVKRLIDRDRSGMAAAPIPVPVVASEEDEMTFSKSTIKAFF